MKALFASATLVIGLMASSGAFAKVSEAPAPAGAPAGATGLCQDGSYNTSKLKFTACKGHKGLQTWFTAAPAAAVSAAPAGATPTATPPKKGLASLFAKKPAAAGAATAGVATAGAATAATSSTGAAKTVAPGGGAGQVWVNTKSKVYHCQGSKDYGTTKAGQYMTEAAAKAAGARAAGGKACS